LVLAQPRSDLESSRDLPLWGVEVKKWWPLIEADLLELRFLDKQYVPSIASIHHALPKLQTLFHILICSAKFGIL